jgi:multidrug efflux system membrane fusion protein
LQSFVRTRFTASILLVLLSLPLGLVLTSCSQGQGAPDKGAGAPGGAAPGKEGGRAGGRGRGGDVAITMAPVVEMALPEYVQAVGNVEPASTVEVRSQVTGPLMEVHFTEGQDVQKGQLLFTIDPRPFDLAVRQAEAQLAKDSGQSKTAETQRTRYASLLARGLVSQEQHDAVAAQANSLQGTIAADQVQVDNAKLQLQYTKILAPVSGRTGALQVHQGSLVRNAEATPMVVINQLAPVHVAFSAPASYLPAIRANQGRSGLQTEAFVVTNSPTPSAVGSLTFVDNTVDPTTESVRLKATFANANRALWPGQFLQVRLRLSVDPRAIVTPQAAIQNGPQGQYVYVVNADRTVALRPVKVGRTEGRNVIIAEGLQVGENVVTDGQLLLVPGSRVSVKTAGVPTP